APGRSLVGSQTNECIDGRARDAQRHGCDIRSPQVVERRVVEWARLVAPPTSSNKVSLLRHEQVVHAKIVAARTAQANGVPGVEDLAIVRRRREVVALRR